MRQGRQDGSRGANAGRWLLAAAVAGAALAAGTVHTIVLCIVTLALAAAMALTWWNTQETRFGPRPSATLLLVIGTALTAFTALQTVPLPMAWLATLAPRNADVWSRALLPLHEAGPSWAPISLDPTATRIEALKGVAYLLAFVTALRIARTRDGVGFLSATLMGTGTVLALTALLHPAFGARKLYGVYQPSVAVLNYDRHLAPFLNPNNLAAYLNIALCLALAAAMAPQPRLPRSIPAAMALFLAATQVWVASRGGVATMLLGAALVVIMMRGLRLKDRHLLAAESVLAMLAMVASAFVLVLTTSSQPSSELFDADTSKLALFRQSIGMIPAFPIFGTGRGAFESTFPAFRQSPGLWTFTHPECVLAQWIVEWGMPLGLAGLVAIAVALRPATVHARSATSAGAWAAITAVAVQNLVDLGSEIPGLMLSAVVCAAIVVGGTPGRESRWRVESWSKAPRRLALAGMAITACSLIAACVGLGKELGDDRDALYRAGMEERAPVTRLHALAHAALLRHPGEPYLPFIVGWRAGASGEDDPLPWIEATLERANVYGPAHLVLARLLATRAPSQARLEYRLAMEQGAPSPAPRELARLVAGYYDAMEIVPQGSGGVPVLQELVGALSARLPATCVRLDEELSARSTEDAGPALRAATTALDDLQSGEGAPWCEEAARPQCVKQALDAAVRAERIAPALCEPYVLQARTLIADGDAPRGLAELTHAVSVTTERVQCLEALATLADDVHNERLAEEALNKIAASGCAGDAECAANLAWIADREERRGNTPRALAFYRRAYARTGDDALLETIARLAASVGLHTEAADGYSHLARKHPEQVSWQHAAAAERDAALKAATRP